MVLCDSWVGFNGERDLLKRISVSAQQVKVHGLLFKVLTFGLELTHQSDGLRVSRFQGQCVLDVIVTQGGLLKRNEKLRVKTTPTVYFS